MLTYEEYKQLQINGSGLSFGTKWGDQMEAAILFYLKDVPKTSKIIDIGCGEGRGLIALKKIGFNNLSGVDISSEKISMACSHDIDGRVIDFHDLTIYPTQSFDYLFCSHAIEHSIHPQLVVQECLRIAKNGLFIVPIDDKPQPELGQSPHTSNFATEQQWVCLFDKYCTRNHKHESQERLGKEIWTYFYEI